MAVSGPASPTKDNEWDISEALPTQANMPDAPILSGCDRRLRVTHGQILDHDRRGEIFGTTQVFRLGSNNNDVVVEFLTICWWPVVTNTSRENCKEPLTGKIKSVKIGSEIFVECYGMRVDHVDGFGSEGRQPPSRRYRKPNTPCKPRAGREY